MCLAHGTLPWSLLLPQGPHLQDGFQTPHPGSIQVLRDTHRDANDIQQWVRGTHAQVACTNLQVTAGPGCLWVWLCQPHNLLDARPQILSGITTSFSLPGSLARKTGDPT